MFSLRSIRLLLFAILMCGFMTLALPAPLSAQVSVGVSVSFGPPALPVYEQPFCPGDDYIWVPGYWAWDGDYDDYYWVPGTWVLAPEPGLLWTPGYWGWGGDAFFWHEGYWGPEVGFYGGISYGFGYFGEGYEGGRWDHGHFFYNREVTNVNVTVIHNVYNERVNIRNDNHVSYNGGNGGINARPTARDDAAMHEKHVAPVTVQQQHVQAARSNPELRASANHGKPAVAATPRPGAFSGGEVKPAKQAGAPYSPPANRGGARSENNSSRPSTAVHPKDLPPATRPTAPNTGNPKLDQKYQQQQDKMMQKQEQDRQKLQQKQDQEHQRLQQQRANDARQQQLEQTHQQQTPQMEQRHKQQQQNMQRKQQPPPPKQQRQQSPPPKKPGPPPQHEGPSAER